VNLRALGGYSIFRFRFCVALRRQNFSEELKFMATTLEQNTLEAQPREAGTKNHARRVRQGGKIPAVVYGAGKDSLPITVDPRHVLRILHSETGHNTIFDLALSGGENSKAMIVDWQYEPIKGSLLHIDLKRIAMDQKLRVNVPIELVGEPAGVKQQGGILEQITREVEVECLPGDIPNQIDLDVSELVFNMVLRVADLPKSDEEKPEKKDGKKKGDKGK
jgi:large subunit ribosomal protein L25